ncbi:MAG: phage tail sheath C-terminal domain-containing protein [Mycetocola sp.]
MAIQVSYPGVYIDEYAPAAPIEGVSTSIAAFIGICEKGPTRTPTLVTSFDAFTALFGGPLVDATPYYLPLAVAGFFRNGGTTAFIVRVGTAVAATGQLDSADGTAIADVTAIADGTPGDGGSVTVTHSSALATALTSAGAGTTVPLLRASTSVDTVDATRRLIDVGDSSGFAAGDAVHLENAGDSHDTFVAGVSADVVRLTTAIPAAKNLIGGSISTADPGPGTTRIRLDVPPAVSLRAAVPIGSVVTFTGGANPAWGVVADVGADSVTLARPLTEKLDLTVPATLATAEFSLDITDVDGVTRSHGGLSTSPMHPRWWGTAVSDSYARVVVDPGAFPSGDPRPVEATTAITGSTPEDPAASWTAVASDILDHLALLAPIDEISIVAVPGCTDIAAQQAVVEHCETQFDRFAVLDAVPGADLVTVLTQRASLTGTLDKGFGALYHPWIRIKDPISKQEVLQPPSGHIVGIYAKTDQTRGVHKAPANVGIAGAIGLERRLGDADHGFINLQGVNALRILPGRGQPVVYGARTTAGDTNWQYINIRRLFLFLEESIQEGLSGSVFEPNDLALWQRLKRTITEFLTRVWRDGALFGDEANDAFFVRIDEALNPPATRKLGRLYIEIGVQPVYPAEFIIVRIGIWDGGAEVTEA